MGMFRSLRNAYCIVIMDNKKMDNMIITFAYVYTYISLPGKIFSNDSNQKITLAVKANFYFDFGLVLAILRRYLPLHNDGNQLPTFFQL